MVRYGRSWEILKLRRVSKSRSQHDSRVLHLDWTPGLSAYWIHRVLAAVQAHEDPIVRARLSDWGLSEGGKPSLGDLAVASETKRTMIPLIVARLDKHLKEITDSFRAEPDVVAECLQSGYAFTGVRNEAVHEALVDFDAFLFECLSEFEITVDFVRRFFLLILGRKLCSGGKGKAVQQVEKELELRGARTGWLKFARRARNLFIHERASWLAFDVDSSDPTAFRAVLLSRCVTDLKEDPDQVCLAQLTDAWHGFLQSADYLETWLKEELSGSSRVPTVSGDGDSRHQRAPDGRQ
jgi:hypothetical protein